MEPAVNKSDLTFIYLQCLHPRINSGALCNTPPPPFTSMFPQECDSLLAVKGDVCCCFCSSVLPAFTFTGETQPGPVGGGEQYLSCPRHWQPMLRHCQPLSRLVVLIHTFGSGRSRVNVTHLALQATVNLYRLDGLITY